MTTKKPETILFLSDARGIYIPRDFANGIKPECLSGASAEDIATLQSGPDAADYWEAWDAVLNSARVTDADGVVYTPHQDGDLWLIPVGMEWNDDAGFYEWPKDPDCAHEDHPGKGIGFCRHCGVSIPHVCPSADSAHD